MSPDAQWFDEFAAALRDPDRPPPGAVDPGDPAPAGLDPVCPAARSHKARFDVHRNTFVQGLLQAIRDTLPACRGALGQPVFDTLALTYLRDCPPRSPVLTDWTDGFAAWCNEADSPVGAWPWLGDLSKLELARVRAFHAADARPESGLINRITHLDDAQLRMARLTFHPSMTLLRSRWQVVSCWQSLSGGPDAAQCPQAGAESALILRDDAREGTVLVVPLSEQSADLMERLLAQRPLGEAWSDSREVSEDPIDSAQSDPLIPTLALLLRHAALIDLHTPARV